MSLSVYDASIPVFLRALHVLSTLLDKAAAYATASNIDPASLVDARLAPDMLTLAGQVQRASDSAKGCAARLTGQEAPGMADSETTLADLQSRISKTIAYLEGFRPDQFDGAETRTVTLKAGLETLSYNGRTYLLAFAVPNFFFHIAMAYAILRHKGVGLGKLDYLGPR
jgi:hypothetical protein